MANDPSRLYLGDREDGIDAIKDRLFERVYEGCTHKPRGGEAQPITRDDLERRDLAKLFEALARQSRFPLPEKTGNARPVAWEKAKELPNGLRDKAAGQTGEYLKAIDNLLNAKNRAIGARRQTRHGAIKRSGNTGAISIDTQVFDDIIGWMADHLPDGALTLPEPEKEKKSGLPRTPSQRYIDRDGSLKEAFFAGMGADHASDKRSFWEVFSIMLEKTGAAAYSTERPYRHSIAPQNFPGHRTLAGATMEIFNPEAVVALGSIKGLVTSFSSKLYKASAIGIHPRNEWLTPDDVFKIGYTLRDSGKLSKLAGQGELGFTLGEKPEIPEHMLNQDWRALQARRGGVEAGAVQKEEAEAAPSPIVRQVGRVEITAEIVPPEHGRMAENGETVRFTLKEPGEPPRVKEYTALQSAAAVLASTAARVGRYKEEARGINTVAAALSEAVRQRAL